MLRLVASHRRPRRMRMIGRTYAQESVGVIDEMRPRSRRVSGKWQIKATTLAAVECVAATDVSTTGLFFKANVQLEVGKRLGCEVSTGPDDTIRAVIEIVRSEELEEGVFGHGARFLAMTDEDRIRLGSSLTAMRQRELAEDFAPRITFGHEKAAR
jgi:hypothetical protein